MPKQPDLIKTTNRDNEASNGSFSLLVDETQDEGARSASPMDERRRNDGMTSLHDVFGTVHHNFSMMSSSFSSPMQGLQPPAWPSPWNDQNLREYHFPSNNSSPQVHHILHIINSVFETLDDEQDDDRLLGNPKQRPVAPQ